jgi:hypothetical protein
LQQHVMTRAHVGGKCWKGTRASYAGYPAC